MDKGILAGDMAAIYRVGALMLVATVAATAVSIGSSWSAASLGPSSAVICASGCSAGARS